MKMTDKILLAAGSTLIAAAAALTIRKRREDNMIREGAAAVREEVPEDVVGGFDVLTHILDLKAFDDLAEWVCMQPCCYTPMEEPIEIWIDPDDV